MADVLINGDLADWKDREYVSQFSMPALDFEVWIDGQRADPDGGTASAVLWLQNGDGTQSQAASYTADHVATGLFRVTPSSQDTGQPSDAALVWSYSYQGMPQQYVSPLVIGPANPHYDRLPWMMKDEIELCWARFADCADSPSGGPNISATPYFQAHWSRGRMAQMAEIAIGKINGSSQPYSRYSLDGHSGPMFPVRAWGGLLQAQTFVESVRHLIRSYNEQPLLAGGGGITRLDRRDYTDRWRETLRDEEPDLKNMLDMFKIRHMGLGNPRVLVSGGTYGRYAPTRIAGSVAARPRMWARWY
jgi:hypothetical protein